MRQRSTLATATHAHRWGVLRDENGRTRVSWSNTSVMVVTITLCLRMLPLR